MLKKRAKSTGAGKSSALMKMHSMSSTMTSKSESVSLFSIYIIDFLPVACPESVLFTDRLSEVGIEILMLNNATGNVQIVSQA